MGNYSHLPTNAYDQAGDASGLGTPFANNSHVACSYPSSSYRKMANLMTYGQFLDLKNRGFLSHAEQATGHFNAQIRLSEIYQAVFSGRNYISIWCPCPTHSNCHQEIMRYPVHSSTPAEAQLHQCPIESFYPGSMVFGPSSLHCCLDHTNMDTPGPAPGPGPTSGPAILTTQKIYVSGITDGGLVDTDKISDGSTPCQNVAFAKGEPSSVSEGQQGIIGDASVGCSKRQRLAKKIGKGKTSICEFAKKLKAQYTKPYVPVRNQDPDIQDYGDLLASMPLFPSAEETSRLLLYAPY
ncbi:hypothetical protein BROUX41_006615 [Berkeleyomyces rouxiae]|uniref:uncharacterized protein n=1 Tax=Berkeleyomyces rouxiae TaxID=2035830 RepID=UPI003B80BA0A